MNNNSNNCGDCGTTCSECGRPWAICKQDGGCGCNKCKDIKFCEYGRMANGCIREKQPGCPMQAVIPSVTVESIEGIKNLADCLVHVSDINTTFYIDDKHRPIITWAGPIDIPGYDMEGNPNNYRDQIVTDVANQIAVIYDKSGNGYLFGLAENLDVQEEINNKLDEMAEDGTLEVILQEYLHPFIQSTNDRLTIIQNDVNSLKNAYGAPLIASSGAGMTDHNRIYVYVGTTGGGLTNGHWYYWTGEAWSDGGVYQSAGIGTGAIGRENLNSWFASELDKDSYKAIGENTGNLIWSEDIWNGYFQYNGSGVLQFFANANYKSVLLRVTAGATYYINKLTHFYYTADSNFNKISQAGSSGTDATDVEITIPANATYLIVSFRVANGVKDVCVSTSQSYTLPNRYVLGKYLAKSEYTYVMLPSRYIEVTDDNILKLPQGFIVAHGQSMSFSARDVELDTTLSEGVNVVVCNVDTKATRVIGWKNLNPDNILTSFADETNPREFILAIYYAPYLWIGGNRIDISQYVYKPLHIAFMGDSITAGNNCTKAYHMYLHDVTRQHCHNYGCGGTGFVATDSGSSGKVGGGMEGVPSSASQQHGNNTIGEVIDTVPESFTNFVVCGGTNDYGGNVSMSNFSNAVQAVIDKLYDRSATFMFMTPIRRNYKNRDGETPNTQGLKLSDYVNKIIELCIANGVRYVDMYNNTSLNPNNTYNKSKYVPDGLHPNNTGQKLMAEKAVDTFKNVFTDFK